MDARDAAKVAGASVADAADRFADAAERAGSAVLARWTLLRQKQKEQKQQEQHQENGEETVQARLRSAAASTSSMLRKGYNETKEKVAAGKVKFGEVLWTTYLVQGVADTVWCALELSSGSNPLLACG